MMSDDLPRFNSDHVRRLKQAGVIDAQIKEIEHTALPVARAILTQHPSLMAVRDELYAFKAAIGKAKEALSRLSAAKAEVPHLFEALQRVTLADYDINNSGDTIRKATHVMIAAREIVDRADTDLGNDERRHRTAIILPIQRISSAMLRGFLKAHKGAAFLPPYTFRESASPGSPFRTVVGVCYEVIGQNPDPERALKAYIFWRRSQNKKGREVVARLSARDKLSDSGSTGQQAPGNSDLPS